jgi:hypothetical protein
MPLSCSTSNLSSWAISLVKRLRPLFCESKRFPGTYVYLAGRPAELEVVLKAAGVRSLIYAGCDVLAVLQGAHAFLGIEFGSVH